MTTVRMVFFALGICLFLVGDDVCNGEPKEISQANISVCSVEVGDSGFSGTDRLVLASFASGWYELFVCMDSARTVEKCTGEVGDTTTKTYPACVV